MTVGDEKSHGLFNLEDKLTLNRRTADSNILHKMLTQSPITADDDFGMQSLSDVEDEPIMSMRSETYAESLNVGNELINDNERKIKEGFVFVEQEQNQEGNNGEGWKWLMLEVELEGIAPDFSL